MWNLIKNRKLKRDWRLVSTLQAQFSWTINDNPSGQSDVYYYLSENGLGQRKCKVRATDSRGVLSAKTHPFYLGKIAPWLEGQYDPKIPSYETIKAKEFKDALAGKVT